MRPHILAQVQHALALAQGVHESADAAVDPRLLGQAGIILRGAGEGLLVLAEAAGGHHIPGVQHAVRAAEHLGTVSSGVEFPRHAAFEKDGPGIALQHILHGGVLFLHIHICPLPAGKEQVGQQAGEQRGYILTDQRKFHGSSKDGQRRLRMREPPLPSDVF